MKRIKLSERELIFEGKIYLIKNSPIRKGIMGWLFNFKRIVFKTMEMRGVFFYKKKPAIKYSQRRMLLPLDIKV